ncbi:MAG: FAA hydrolase family protein [Candidatus Nephthysia bennettiae]|uniref:Fumarylacetoacetate hydrolase family protein n=1 Tax=Candidatus Nephthysia bennettiae TaxID=3127016 RepID=A0A934K8P8_9BACT|nr:fumarylacetoacetate hydrolase family protein [Candidatus Dormibacteraeota bacterium]MBJ7611867.1 fumarylacetoacetate hydrolase family protein [Candidatus Dormibacteraeota bacterium]PZR88975.1 MAG: FAA hydrolase family protein [Candidatus Dormibacteraeota bacterium]
MKPWSLVSYRTPEGDHGAGALHENRVVELPLPASGVLALIEEWDEVEPALRAFDPATAREIPGAALLLPLRFPRKLICAGANYHSHVREMGINRQEGARPYFFLKPPTTTLIGPGEAISIPSDPAAKVDWEGELAVVMGRGGKHIPESKALSHVAGYSALNDISLRGPHRVPKPIAEPFAWDWLASKGADRSAPLGPGIRPAFSVADPQRLDLRLWVNGHLKQEANTADMIDGVAALVAAASELFTLEPGDVIATGTPDGVGMPRGEFLRPGDLVEMEISDFGRLSNPVVAQ